MKRAPESYLDCKRPSLVEAIRLEGDMTIGEAAKSLEKKGYYTARPRPWSLGFRDRGHARGDFAVLDKFGDVVVEVPNQSDAELIISAVNAYKVVGYIIQNAKGSFLAKRYFWYEHDLPKEAWVHPENTIDSIRNTSKDWVMKPTQKILAHYSVDSGITIFGKPEPF